MLKQCFTSNSRGNLAAYLAQQLPQGMLYRDAAQVCQWLYVTIDLIPQSLRPSSAVDLADEFVLLTKRGWVRDQESYYRNYFGAHHHAITDRGHWIEVMACTTKQPERFDFERCQKLARRVGLGFDRPAG